MPVIYARISDRPVADEYCAFTTQVEPSTRTQYRYPPTPKRARPVRTQQLCAVVADVVDGGELDRDQPEVPAPPDVVD